MSIGDNQFSLCSISVIVSSSITHKAIKIAKECGALGSTTVLCRGTVTNKFLELLDLNEDRRELIFIIAERHLAENLLMTLNTRLKLTKPNHGIAFATEICSVRGMHNFDPTNLKESNNLHIEADNQLEADNQFEADNLFGADNQFERPSENKGEPMYNSIYVVVDKGKANDVIESSKKAGARGGTIFGARGSGIHETHKLFSMEVEPEKEVVLILVTDAETDNICNAIVKDMKLEEPGNGVLYVQRLIKAYGLY